MGEAKRRKAAKVERTWAKGSLRIEANGELCFEWIAPKDAAREMLEAYCKAVSPTGYSPESYASRAAGYLIAYGMPEVGDARPNRPDDTWQENEIAVFHAAILWLVLSRPVPALGRKCWEVFAGKSMLVMLDGDKDKILDDTEREREGRPLSDEQIRLVVASIGDYLLDPDEAVAVPLHEMFVKAGHEVPDLPNDPVYVPRIPRDATEAEAMMQNLVIFLDATQPEKGIREFAGYTDAELRRGKPAVHVG